MDDFFERMIWMGKKCFNVNARDRYGNTPLMKACEAENLAEVKRLLKLGADPELRNGGGYRAIEIAVLAEKPDIVDMLAESMPKIRDAFAAAAERAEEAEIYRSAVEEYATKKKLILRPADPDDLARLQSLGLPENLMVFYRHFEPWQWKWTLRFHGCPEVMWLNEVRHANTKLRQFGFVVFGDTLSGDPFCYNLNELSARGLPRIYLFSHESVGALTDEEFPRAAKLIAEDLVDFLEKASQDQLDTEPKDAFAD